MSVDLTVSIINNNNKDLILECIGSVYRAGEGIALEVVVVDNLSGDGSAEEIQARYPSVMLIRNVSKEGFSSNHNKAVRASNGEFVLILNDDTLVHKDALVRMLNFMRGNQSAGAVGGLLVNPDGSPQHTGRSAPTLLAAIMISLGLHRLFPNNPVTAGYFRKDVSRTGPEEVESVNGSAMMLRRSALDKVGLLDEGFFLFCEDVDLSIRLREAGYGLYLLPDALVTHYRGKSTGGRRIVWIYHRSLMRFYRKHYAGRSNFLVNGLLYAGIMARFMVYWVYGNVRKRG